MNRIPEYPIDKLFTDRWSPRAFSSEIVSKKELMSLFEAAKWAPSSYNNQPWRFTYACKNTPYWDAFLSLLVPFNQSWAQHASCLVVIASRNNFEFNEKPSRTHSFDTGAAWQNLALQATKQGLIAHGMEGFDYEKAKNLIQASDAYTIEAMVAIGKPGKKETLPIDLQKTEEPNDRKKLEETVFEGKL